MSLSFFSAGFVSLPLFVLQFSGALGACCSGAFALDLSCLTLCRVEACALTLMQKQKEVLGTWMAIFRLNS